MYLLQKLHLYLNALGLYLGEEDAVAVVWQLQQPQDGEPQQTTAGQVHSSNISNQ
jgi:hypothetical protein